MDKTTLNFHDQGISLTIQSAEVDHYSYNEDNQFMIVKTVEEMTDIKKKVYVLHTIRIYREAQEEVESNEEVKLKLKSNNSDNNFNLLRKATSVMSLL